MYTIHGHDAISEYKMKKLWMIRSEEKTFHQFVSSRIKVGQDDNYGRETERQREKDNNEKNILHRFVEGSFS